ncbi:MAG: PAC2 family protein [Nitrososphaerales archaeon]|nr:PAC2 family protein [Nitrososphaerales archaeon]
MWLNFEAQRNRRYKRPVLLVAVSTSIPQYRQLYSQGRELAKHMLKTMKFEEVAVMHSSSFPPEVLVRDDGISTLLACRIYLSRGRRDVLLFAGDSSPMEDQYEVTRLILSFAKAAGVRELYSVGARWTENPVPQFQDPVVNGFATDSAGVKALKEGGVKMIAGEPAPFFASMVVGMAKEYGIRGYKVSVDHGEPAPHPRSVVKMLEVLSSMIGFEARLDELRSQIVEPPQANPPSAETIYH